MGAHLRKPDWCGMDGVRACTSFGANRGLLAEGTCRSSGVQRLESSGRTSGCADLQLSRLRLEREASALDRSSSRTGSGGSAGGDTRQRTHLPDINVVSNDLLGQLLVACGDP